MGFRCKEKKGKENDIGSDYNKWVRCHTPSLVSFLQTSIVLPHITITSLTQYFSG
jgi:hypothetical protein